MTDKIFPKGIRTFAPKQGAPDFVLGDVVITLNELVKFCKENEGLLSEYNGEKQLKLQITKSQKGTIVFAVNTYKKGSNNNDDLPF